MALTLALAKNPLQIGATSDLRLAPGVIPILSAVVVVPSSEFHLDSHSRDGQLEAVIVGRSMERRESCYHISLLASF